MPDSRPRGAANDDVDHPAGTSIDELLDQAVAAINRGDRGAASELAGQVLAVDLGNADAEDLLTLRSTGGEIRRLTILFADLVDATILSTRLEPGSYGLLVGRYRDLVLDIVNRFGGHIGSPKGEGLLAVFGYPQAHEDDARRAVWAGLEISHQVARLGEQLRRRVGSQLAARVGIHRGLVYLDTGQDDVYGLGANLAARVAGLAPPGAVVVSDVVAPLLQGAFELLQCPAAAVKGVVEPIAHHRVLGERETPARSTRGPLVGRDREVARLQENWADVQAGTRATAGLVLWGEPGIGKSRLAAAAAGIAENSGAVVLELAGSSLHTDAGLHPIRTLLEHRSGISRLTPQDERLRLLEAEVSARGLDPLSTVPLLAPVLSIAPEYGYQPAPAEGRRLYELIKQAVQDYVLASVGDRAGLVIAEDAHWFDPSTIEMLGSLLANGTGRLLLVITGRPGDWLPRQWPVEVIELKPLTQEQTDTLIDALDPGLSSDDRAAIAGRCDGVPFYIEQVVTGLRTSGVPEGLYEPLLARLRASANVVPVVEAAALIGRHLDRGLLTSVVELSDEALDDVLGELEDAQVFEPWGTNGWRFRHELLREVAAELAPPSVRRELHSKVANALIGGAGGEPDWQLVAAHYERAENHGGAVSAYQRASTAARRRGAVGEARGYLTNALTQIDRQGAERARDLREMAVRLERGFLASVAEGPLNRATATDFECCLRLGGAEVRDDEVFETLLALAGYYFAVGDLARSTGVFEALRAGLTDGREFFGLLIRICLGIAAWLRGAFATAGPQIQCAAEELLAADQHTIEAMWFAPTDPLTMAHGVLALDRIAHGDLRAAQAQVAQAARRADGLSFPHGPFSVGFARFFEIWVDVEAHRFDHAAAAAFGLIDHAQRHGFEVWALWGRALRATVDALASIGSDDPAVIGASIARATELVQTVRAAGLTVYITLFEGALGQALAAAGHREQARARLEEAIALGRSTEMCFYEAELLRLRAHTQDDPATRRSELAAALDLARRQGTPLYELRAALDDFELRGGPARQALVEAFNRMPTDSPLPELARARRMLA